ncbi:MAG: hypothetical protein QGF09_03990 [Rhodospirillales bacterium]|nr:hypothetical protein [Rhodospirillales bacterium]
MFFDQIKEIDGNIKQLRDELKNIGEAANAHFDQLDDLAAHIIAVEAILCVALKSVDVDGAAVKEWIKTNTSDSSDNEVGSEKVHMVAEQLLNGG